jgi:ribosome-binding factor A
MRASSHRPQQVAETVRQVVAEALVREVRDPRVGLVTLTGIVVTADLGHAKIKFVASSGEPDAAEQALEGLQSAAGFLRSRLAKALGTRIVPELHFEIDRGGEHAARINEVLASLQREEPAD